MSDAEFDLSRFHAGDERLFSQLVRLHSPRLLPFLRQYASDSAEAYDLLQEVWLRAFAKRALFRGDGSLLGWLFAIARNVGIQASRRKRISVELSAAESVGIIDEDARIDADRRQQRIRAAVAELPDRQRDIVIMRLVEDRPIAEVARLLRCAPGTVKAALHHAVRKLRRQLQPNESGLL